MARKAAQTTTYARPPREPAYSIEWETLDDEQRRPPIAESYELTPEDRAALGLTPDGPHAAPTHRAPDDAHKALRRLYFS